MKNSINFIIFLLNLFCQICYAQPNNTSFPQNTPYHLYCDTDLKLYVSSSDGLNLYACNDPQTFSPHNTNIKGNNIQSPFYEDINNDIWFTTYLALNHYDRKADAFEYFTFKNCNNNPVLENYSILNYTHPNLLVKADSCLIIFDVIQKQKIKCLPINTSNFSNTNLDATYINDEIIISGRKSNAATIEVYTKQGVLLKEKVFTSQTQHKHIKPIGNNHFLVSLDNKLFNYNLKKDNSKELLETEDNIVHFFIYNDSNVLLLTNQNIINHNLKTKTIDWTYSINAHGNKASIYTKDLKNIFYSVDGEGVYFFNIDKRKFEHYYINQDSITLNARSPLQDKDNNFYFTSRDNGIKYTDEKFNLIDTYILNPEFNLIFDVASDSNGNIFANGGYNIFHKNHDSKGFKQVYFNKKSSDFYYDLFINKADEVFLLDGSENGFKLLSPIHKSDYALKPYFDQKQNNKYLSAFELKDTSLLLGVSGYSISYFDYSNSKYNYIVNHNIESDIKSIWQVPHSKEVYVSSSLGLFHFPNGLGKDFIKLKDKKGLLSQNIYSILGHEQFLYLSSNNGLLRYNTQDSTVHQFTINDGIQGKEYNTTAALIDSKGRFIFGGTNGINVFYPDSIKLLEYNTPILLTNILINDDEYNWQTNISLKDSIKFDYKNNTLTFQFHGIDYSDPKAVELQCKMENYDSHWVHFDKNEGSMRYPNLPPGHYTFKMQATNSDKVWSNIIKEIDIEITPPIWQTWWFRLLASLLIASLVWLMIKSYYKRQLQRKDLELREQRLAFDKQQALQNERNRIASEMHDDLGGGLTSIKFLAHRILKKKPDVNPNELVEKIVNQSGQLINNMSEIIWAMNSGFDTLNNLIAYIRNHIKKQCQNFDLTYLENIPSHIDELEYSGQKRRNIFLVTKEAMHNIVKHANATEVHFAVNISKDMISITITDNGRGITEENQFGNGLQNMKNRITEIGGTLRIENKNGTSIHIDIPN